MHHREGKHVLSHAAIYLIARGLPGILAFLTIPLFTRLLKPEEYGRYALVLATVMLLNALLFQWLRLSLVRYLPAFKDDPARLKSTLISVTAVLILAMGPIAAVIAMLPVDPRWRAVAFPCWALLAVQAMFELCNEYSRAILKPWQYMGLQVTRSGSIIILGVLLIERGAGWWGPLIGMTAGMAAGVIWAYRKDWLDARFQLDNQVLRQICQYGIPLSITVALTVVISSSDRFLIAHYLGEAAAGLYSVAVDFTAQTLTLLMLVINLAMFPIAVRAFEHNGRDAAQEAMKSNASLLMAVGLPCVVGLTVLAPGIAHCFLGKEYRIAAVSIIPLIALGTFVAGLKAYHFDAAFQFAHRTIYQVWIVLFAAVVNLVLNVIAIPHWGINGAAVASVLAFVVSIVLTVWLGRRHFELPFPPRACAVVLLASAVMGAMLYPMRNHIGAIALSAQIIAGAIVYAGILLSCNFLELRDQLLRKVALRRQREDREICEPGIEMDIDTGAEPPVGTLVEAK
jgi:O-antigen/teichoic acid export membrane protein